MVKIDWCVYLFLFLFGFNLYGQSLNKDHLYFTQNSIQFTENQLENQNDLNELILNLNSDEEKLYTLLSISEKYLNKNLYKESLKYIFQAEVLSNQISFENLKAYTYILLAAFYRGLEFNNKANENLDKAIAPLSLIENEQERRFIEAKLQLEKGLLNLNLLKEKEGIANLLKSKSKFQSLNNKISFPSLQLIHSKLGNHYLKNDLDSARFYFKQNLKLSNEFNFDADLELLAKNGMSKYYVQIQQHDSVSKYVNELIPLIEKAKDVRIKKGVFKNLAEIYYSSNDVENYKIYNQKFLNLNDSIYELDKETRVLLANQASHAESGKDSSNQLLWTMLILGLALIGLFLTYAYHLKVKKEYAQFQKIMREIDGKESLKIQHTQELNAGNPYVISEKTEQIILDKLKKFEDSEKYINPKVSLQFLAKQLDTNTKYLSEIINKSKGQNFNNYINELRIHYILRKLKSEPKYQNYKVSSLGEECGFNSRNTFTLAFKTALGISPAKFISFMKKENLTDKA